MKLKHGTALENQANNEILKVGNLNDGIQKEISRRDLAKVIETHLSLLFRECLRIVQDGGFDEKIPAGFVFTGGTSNLEGIQDLGKEIMQKNNFLPFISSTKSDPTRKNHLAWLESTQQHALR